MLVNNFAKEPADVFQMYIKNTKFINNWDLVDVSAHKICGAYCLQSGNSDVIWCLAKSDNLWENRIAMVSTLSFIKSGNLALTIDLCKHFLSHRHHLMHKACGWMLRELGKRDQTLLLNFVNSHNLPSIMKSYALEIVKKSQSRAL
jgi:3-methyladenine DNA glycosylase AlkD